MTEKTQKVITRFAPSPTGFMHVGGVRTALYAWLFARKHKGTFILRIEDTDKEREMEGSIEQIIESLKWLGIDWDEGVDIGGPNAPYIQSKRLDTYREYAHKLIDKGLAYVDPYTKEELDEFRKKAEAEKRPFLYRNHRPENPPKWNGKMPLRFKTPKPKVSVWQDAVRGRLEAGPEALDDIILIKSDGYPTYNFAHIIDDLLMGVTHIFRADEFISSMPNYLALYEALDIEPPVFATLPPIMAPDGKRKLGKRDGAKDILDYSKEGILPEAMINFLAFIGWNPGGEKEVMSVDEIREAFELSRIHTAGAKFNEEKLHWFQKEHMKLLTIEQKISWFNEHFPSKYGKLASITDIWIEKVNSLEEVKTVLDMFIDAPEIDREGLICPEKLRKGNALSYEEVKAHLHTVIEKLGDINEDNWIEENIKNALWDYATEQGRGIVLWAMRYALSGKEKSPDPFVIAGIIGKAETLSRLYHAVKL